MARSSRHSSSRRERPEEALLPFFNRLLVVLIISGIGALLLLTFYPEWKKLSSMRETLQQERQELSELQRQAAHRERECYLLQHDREYLELIARDRLDLMKPNETIFRFGPPRGSRTDKINK